MLLSLNETSCLQASIANFTHVRVLLQIMRCQKPPWPQPASMSDCPPGLGQLLISFTGDARYVLHKIIGSQKQPPQGSRCPRHQTPRATLRKHRHHHHSQKHHHGTPPWEHHHGSTTIAAPPWQHHHGSITMATPPWQHHHGSTAMAAPPRQHFLRRNAKAASPR